MPGIGSIKPALAPRFFQVLGKKITNEPVKQAIEAVGTAGIAPLAIIMSPGPNTRECKNEKKYQALRQIPSIVLKYGMAFVVAALVGKKIAKSSWKSFLPKNMQSKLCINTDKIGTLDDLLKELGMKAKDLPKGFDIKFKNLIGASKRIVKKEKEIKSLHTMLNDYMEPIIDRLGKTITNKDTLKALKAIKQEKSLVKRFTNLQTFTKQYSILGHDVRGLNSKYFTSAKDRYVLLKNQAKNINNPSATKMVREVRESGLLIGKKLEKFDSLINEYTKPAFTLFKQMLSAGVAMCTLPFSAYFLNVVYPPFVKLAAPNLAKEVEEANR